MGSLLGLRDIAGPLTERVEIGNGHFLDVTGMSTEAIWKLLERFPDASTMLERAGGNEEKLLAAMKSLFKKAPDAIAAIIACADQDANNPEVEAIAAKLPMGIQMRIMKAIGRVTFPDGFGPFVEDLRSAGGGLLQAVTVGQVSTSPKPPKPSVQPDTPPSTNSPLGK